MSFVENITCFQPINALDAFGRIRVSTPYNLFDSKQTVINDSTTWDQQLLSGTSTFTPATAQTALAVSGTSGAFAVRQSFQGINYTAGKGQLALFTATHFHPQTDVVKRIGLFNSDFTAPYTSNLDGYFFMSSGATVSVNIGNLGVIETANQSAWNIDKFDGAGPSRITISGSQWGLNQIYAVQYQWLGVGQATFGLDINGIFYPCHSFNHANVTTGVYCSNPNHSIRYQINSIGGTGTLNHICSAVQSEGGAEPRYYERGVRTGITKIAGPVKDKEWALLGLRVDPTVTNAKGINIFLEQIEVMTTTSTANGGWSLRANPTFNGSAPTWLPVLNTSGLQYCVGANTNTLLTSGTELHHGLYSDQTSSAVGTFNSNLPLGVGISGNAQTVFLTSWNTVNSADMFGTLDFKVVY